MFRANRRRLSRHFEESESGPLEFTSGAAMDAQAVVGETYVLKGSTTGAEIATLQCVSVGPVVYRLKGRIRFYQSTGTEFDGVFKPVRVGSANAFSWGATPGSRTAGGFIHGGGGTVEIQGLELQGGAIATMLMNCYLIAADTAPATGRNFSACWTRPGVTTTIYGGGFGYTGISPRTCAFAAQARDAPTLSLGGTLTLTLSAEWVVVGGKYPNTSSNTTAWGHSQTGSQSVLPAGANGTGIQETFDSRPAIVKIGDVNIIVLEVSFIHNGTT